jgi:pseudaminic acid cytidylyltransferase
MNPMGTSKPIAVIPARGGSKRVPRKNVRSFAGRPMIGYAIQAARDADVFGQILVSTDDAEIATVARACGAEVPFMRPTWLADDHTPTVPVIEHAVNALSVDDDTPVCCIYPGVPLLMPSDLAKALSLLTADGPEYVFPVAAYPSPIQRALVRDADGRTQPMQPGYTQTRTQDLTPAFFDTGQFYWALAATWRAGLSIHSHARTLVIPEWRGIDIDTPDDWARAEALYRVFSEA